MRSVLYRVGFARAVRVSIRVGEEFPVRQGASGKVLLAFTDMQDAQWHDVREQLWPRRTASATPRRRRHPRPCSAQPASVSAR